MRLLRLAPLSLLALATLLVHCSGSSDDGGEAGGAAGSGAGEGGAGTAGLSGGGQSGGGQAGQPGAGQAGSGQAGQGGGNAGQAGQGGGNAGQAGQGGGDAGQAGQGGGAAQEIVAFDAARITSDSSQPNFQHITAEIDLGAGPFASVILTTDLGTTCYPFEGWKMDPPPAGQNYPADCDAFDRNYEYTLDEPMTPADAPAFELLRAITPFGGPEHQVVDLTDLANAHPGAHRLTVTIPTYSDGAGKISGSNGGWSVTAKIAVTPGTPPRQVLAAIPIFNLDHTMDTVPVPVSFQVPAGTTSGRIDYRVTGHGGGEDNSGDCIGPAEEFCQRTHRLNVDGMQLLKFKPWRTDCDKLCTVTHQGATGSGFDYCLENPTGDMNSVKAPRANWCPGSATPPTALDVSMLGEGEHTFLYSISRVAPGGSWRMSAVYYAYGS